MTADRFRFEVYDRDREEPDRIIALTLLERVTLPARPQATEAGIFSTNLPERPFAIMWPGVCAEHGSAHLPCPPDNSASGRLTLLEHRPTPESLRDSALVDRGHRGVLRNSESS